MGFLPPLHRVSVVALLAGLVLLLAAAAPARVTRTVGVLKLEGDTITDITGGFTVAGSPIINGILHSDGTLTVRGDTLSGTGTLSIPGVEVLGSGELFSGNFSISAPTGNVPDVSRLTSRLNVSGIGASLSALQIVSDGVVVSGAFSVRNESVAFQSLAIRAGGVFFDEGKLTLGRIEFDATGGSFTRDGMSLATVGGTVGGVTITLNGVSAGRGQPFGLTGGSMVAGGLTVAFDSGQILSNGISIGSAAVSGLPRSADFTVANLVATNSGVTIGSGTVKIGTFAINLGGGEFSGSGVVIGTAELQAGSATVSLNGFAAAGGGATVEQGSLVVSGLTTSLTGFTFQPSPELLVIERAQLTVRNTTDFVLEGFHLTPTGHVSATGGSFRAGGVSATLRQPDFRADHINLGEATLSGGGQTLSMRRLEVRGNGVTIGEGRVDLFGGQLDFTNGEFNSRGFSVATGELRLDSIDVTVNGFTFSDRGVALSGGSFSYGGFAVSFTSAPVSNGGAEVAATLQLPASFGGGGAAVDFILREGRVTVESGRISVPAFEIPSTSVGLRDVVIEFDRTTITGSGTADLPMFSLTAGVGLRNGRFSSFQIQADNLNVAIGDTGAFLQTVGVSGKNLDRSQVCGNVLNPHAVHYPSSSGIAQQFLELAGWVATNRSRYNQDIGVLWTGSGWAAGYYTSDYTCWIPPVSFKGNMGATAGPEVFGQAFVRANAGAEFDSAGNFEIDGSLFALFLKIGSAYFRVQQTGASKGTSFGGEVIWDVIIDGTGGISIDPRARVSGDAEVALKVPDSVPVIGGYKFGSVDIAFTQNSIKGSVKVVVTVYFEVRNGSFSINKDHLRPWEVPYTYDLPLATLASTAEDKAMAEASGAVLSVLTNYAPAARWYSDQPGAKAVGPKAAVARELTVPAGADAIIRLNYANPDGNAATQLIGPDGTVYTMAGSEVDPLADGALVAFRAVPAARESSWLLADVPPAPGGADPVYTLVILNPETLGDYVVEVLAERATPVVADVRAVTDGAIIRVDWTAFDPDSEASLDVVLSPERGRRTGFHLVDALPEVDGAGTYVHDLAVAPVPTGTYYAAIRITDGQTGEHWAWSESPLFVANVAAPLTVPDVVARAADGGVLVSWTRLADPGIYAYNVLWGDERADVGLPRALGAPATESHLLLTGLEPGRRYRFSVVALRRSQLATKELAARHALLRDTAVALATGKSAPPATGLPAAEAASLAEQAALVAANLTPAAIKSLAEAPASATVATTKEAMATLYTAGPQAPAASMLTINPNENDGPIVVGTPNTRALVGEPWRTTLEAIDAEGHTITALLDEGPDGMVLTVEESRPGYLRVAITWTPTASLTGRVRVGVEFTDSEGIKVEERFSLFVGAQRNTAAAGVDLLAPLPTTSVIAGRLYQQSIGARAREAGTRLEYRLLRGPAGMVVSADGILSWQTAAPANVGAHPVAVEVIPSNGGRPATLQFTLRVEVSNLVGDINADGFITAADITALAAVLAGNTPIPANRREQHDVNGDDVVDAADVAALVELLGG